MFTTEEIFDDLDKKLIAHYGDEHRNLANARRNRRNATGLWNFQQLGALQYPDGWEDGLTSDEFLSEAKAMLRKKFDDRNKIS